MYTILFNICFCFVFFFSNSPSLCPEWSISEILQWDQLVYFFAHLCPVNCLGIHCICLLVKAVCLYPCLNWFCLRSDPGCIFFVIKLFWIFIFVSWFMYDYVIVLIHFCAGASQLWMVWFNNIFDFIKCDDNAYSVPCIIIVWWQCIFS